MPQKRNAPARKGEGVMCLLGRDTDAYSTDAVRLQYLGARFGVPVHRAALIAGLAFGEAAHA